ncbi:MAG: hypothetical protein KAI47_12125 [Deltaproteobacteria bacterium]|nr:hypothetical protein [Deltaproteobacteria bacterium]
MNDHALRHFLFRFGSLLVAATASLATAQAAPTEPSIESTLSLAPGPWHLTPRPHIDGFHPSIDPGQPALPERLIRVALHPRADLLSLTITVTQGPVDTLPGRHLLLPNPPFRFHAGQKSIVDWGRRKTVVAGRDLAAYGRTIFPTQEVTRDRITNFRGLRILSLRYRPLRYRDSGAELLLTRHTDVKVRYRLINPSAPFPKRFPPDAQIEPRLGEVINKDQAGHWYEHAKTAQKPGYAIVIASSLRKASTKLDAFVALKTAQGFSVTVAGETDIAKAQVGKDAIAADRLRAWLQENYKALNLEYLLIIGNPTDFARSSSLSASSTFAVPMMRVHTVEMLASIKEITPTDEYFAELTSPWDKDGDGKIAEYPDDGGEGGLDFTPEISVGRIPVYDDNISALDSILAKTISYESAKKDLSWRTGVLQAAALLFLDKQYGQASVSRMDAANEAKAIYDQVIAPSGWRHFSLYERAGIDPSKLTSDGPLDTETLIQEWNKGYGIVNLFGHGSPEGIYRLVWFQDDGDRVPGWQELVQPSFLEFNDTTRLTNKRPAVVFHMSCSNGTPEHPNNIAYGLLRHGAVGTVAASRLAIVPDLGTGPLSIGMARDLTAGLIAGKTTGHALLDAKAEVLSFPSRIGWYTVLQFNLYGDPSLRVISCQNDIDCDDGKTCTGVEHCIRGLCHPGTPIACFSKDPCTEARCDESTGSCHKTPRPNGERCDDGLFCTIAETCQEGICRGLPRCEAPGNTCVTGACDETTRSCDVVPIKATGKVCRPGTSRQGVCSAGLCAPTKGGCAVARIDGTDGFWLGLLVLGLFITRRRRRHASPPASRP